VGEPRSAYDLRLRSLDRIPGEPINLCSTCNGVASWSVWLHTPEWMPNGGLTLVLCTPHALGRVATEAHVASLASCESCEPHG
jgi:hypothetical protein